MATLQATTTSNWPHIAPDGVDDVEAIIADYDFTGMVDTLTVTVTEPTDEDRPYLEVYGYASFDVSKPIEADADTVVDREHGYTEEFLERISPYLTEQLVVETVGFEKCRFPLLAGQWVAWPDGTITYNSFDHSPDKPTDPDSDEAAHSTTDTPESSV